MKQIAHIAPARSGHNFVHQMLISWNSDLQINDYENYLFSKKLIGQTVVLQTRDLLNWFASYLLYKVRVHRGNKNIGNQRLLYGVRCWYEITKEFYGETNRLKRKSIPILYDDFFAREDYRRDVCEIFGGNYNESVLNGIPAPYSSFDENTYNNKAQEMNVLERYKQVPEDLIHYFSVLNIFPGLLKFYTKHMPLDDNKAEFLSEILCLKETLYT